MPIPKRRRILPPFTHPSLTTREALYCLYAVQQWESFAYDRGSGYSPGYFYRFSNIEGIINGLDRISRQTALKHHAEGICIAFGCGVPVPIEKSRLDHIIASAHGGVESLENSIVLCRPHNSSKGTKDLLEWWLWKEWPAISLPRRVLCLYARIVWQQTSDEELNAPAPTYVQQFVIARLKHLPSEEYQIALYGSAGAAMLYIRWRKEPRT